MNEQDEQPDKQEPVVEDLTLGGAESSNVRGGSATQSLLKLQDVPAEGRDHPGK